MIYTYLQPIFMISAMVGAVMSGIVIMQAPRTTRWHSPMGRRAVIALFLLIVGMFGWIHCIAYGP